MAAGGWRACLGHRSEAESLCPPIPSNYSKSNVGLTSTGTFPLKVAVGVECAPRGVTSLSGSGGYQRGWSWAARALRPSRRPSQGVRLLNTPMRPGVLPPLVLAAGSRPPGEVLEVPGKLVCSLPWTPVWRIRETGSPPVSTCCPTMWLWLQATCADDTPGAPPWPGWESGLSWWWRGCDQADPPSLSTCCGLLQPLHQCGVEVTGVRTHHLCAQATPGAVLGWQGPGKGPAPPGLAAGAGDVSTRASPGPLP